MLVVVGVCRCDDLFYLHVIKNNIDLTIFVKFFNNLNYFNIFIVPLGLKKEKVDLEVSDEEEPKKKEEISVSYKSTRSGKSEGPADMGATSTYQLGMSDIAFGLSVSYYDLLICRDFINLTYCILQFLQIEEIGRYKTDF